MITLHQPSRRAKLVRLIGVATWLFTSFFAFVVDKGDFFGAAGAVGLSFLLVFVYMEKKAIDRSLMSLRRHFRATYNARQSMTDSQYEDLDEDEKYQFNEASSDLGSAELNYLDSLRNTEMTELSLAIFLTMQWAFGDFVFGYLELLF